MDIAKRLVDDAIAAEKNGLKGRVVIDARGIKYDPKSDPSGTGYGGYDESMREAAARLEKAGFTVELDDKNGDVSCAGARAKDDAATTVGGTRSRISWTAASTCRGRWRGTWRVRRR